MNEAFMRFNTIKSDLRRQQRDLYNSQACTLHIPDGKIVCMGKHHYSSAQTGLASRFIRNFEGPYLVGRHPCRNRSDMLILRDLSTGKELSHPVNVEQLVVVPDRDIIDLQSDNDAVVEMDKAMDSPVLYPSSSLIPSDLVQVAYQFGKYLCNLPWHTATASVACKHVYELYPSAREILNRHGKLRGLTKDCPYLQLHGASHGGTYNLSLNLELYL